MSGRTILVGGGTGLIGQYLCPALSKKGYDVIIISRKARPGIPKTLTWAQIQENGLPDCHAIINLAGANVLQLVKRWSNSAMNEVFQSRIQTTTLLTEAIRLSQKPPEAFISASGVGFYQSHTSISEAPEVDESSPGSSSTFLGSLAQEWEACAKDLTTTDVRYVAMRTGAVLSVHGGVLAQTKLPFWLGLGGRIGSGQQPFPWCHIEDVVGLYIHALENRTVFGPLNVVAPQISTNADYTTALASALNRFAVFPIPAFAVNLMFGKDLSEMLLAGQRVVSRKALETGYKFQHPDIRKALVDLLK